MTAAFLMRPEGSYKIFIDVRGYWVNRGDQLMVQATLEQIRARRPDATVVIRPEVFDVNPSYWMSNGVFPLNSRRGIKGSAPYSHIVGFLCRRPRMISPSEIDLILNCRGFYISDFWADRQAVYDDEVSLYDRFTNPDTKLVCLPQALGPFLSEWSKKLMDYIYGRSSLLYARDRASLRYLSERYPDSPKIKLSQDFTCLVRGTVCETVRLPEKPYVIVILNIRMTDKTDAKIAGSYLTFFKAVAEFLTDRGENVILLNHEGIEDEVLLHKLNGMLAAKLPVYTQLSGVEAKQIIAGAKLLISSRYHGIVSGLTQGVPTLCTSWSHKYTELLKDFKCGQNLLDVMNPEAAVSTVAQALSSPDHFVPDESVLLECNRQAESMWQSVFDDCA